MQDHIEKPYIYANKIKDRPLRKKKKGDKGAESVGDQKYKKSYKDTYNPNLPVQTRLHDQFIESINVP